MSYIITVFVLGFVVLAHEYGHFAAARKAGIPIKVFSIGFGPKFWSVMKGKTEYRISMIPIGGYVLPEMEDEAEFFRIPVNKRIIMAAGGPLASIILPLFCFGALNIFTNDMTLIGILLKPFWQVIDITYKMICVLPSLFTHSDQLSGVVGIVAQGGEYIGMNPVNILAFTALLSLNLAVLNMLPIPALDGGKILLYLMEKIHPKLLKLHLPLAIAGWAFILGLMVYTIVMDVGKYLI